MSQQKVETLITINVSLSEAKMIAEALNREICGQSQGGGVIDESLQKLYEALSKAIY